MRMRPFVGLCAAFAAGNLLAWCSAWAAFGLAFLCLILFGVGTARRNRVTVIMARLALMAFLGAARFTGSQFVAANDVSRLPSTSLTLIGTIDDEIAVEDDPHTDEPAAAKFAIDVSSARLDTGAPISVSGRAIVRMTLVSRVTHTSMAAGMLPQSGDTVELRGRLEPPDGPRNPGGFDYRAYLARKGIYATLAVGQPERARVLQRATWSNPFTMLAHSLRQGVLDACKRSLPHPVDGILAGILIGERHGIPQPIQEEFERTGTTHILATAGLHVGMVVCLLIFALRNSGLPRKPARVAAIVMLGLYAVMAGERAAVLRAVLVAAIYLFGEVVEREPDLPNALAIAALILLLANPNELFDPGFQLSFATVITIVLLMPIFQRLLDRIDRALPPSAGPFRNIAKGFVAVALLSAAAQAGSAPFVAYYFYNVSAVSILANALAVPAVFLVIALGFPMAILYAVHPWLGAPLAFLLRAPLGYILATIHFFSEAPFASHNLAPPSPLGIAGYYVCLWSFAWYLRSAPRVGKGSGDTPKRIAVRRLSMGSGVAVLALGLWGCVSPRPRELRVTFLDVGQGDACILESPSGKVLVVDAGGVLHDGEDDQGRRIVAPYLRFRGQNGIDAMILTHPHADHIGGGISLLRRFPTHEVMDDGVDEDHPQVSDLIGQAVKSGSQILLARRGQTFDFGDGVVAEVLGPSDTLAGAGANNASVVLRVRFGRTAFLLTGDAEAPEEREIVNSGQDIACDVLKVGHHGSRTSSTQEFLAAAHPKIAVISVGKRNLYNHPSPEVVDRLLDNGAHVYRTDRDGAVTCHSDGVSVRVEPMVRHVGVTEQSW
jgi:competence protein ComEC